MAERYTANFKLWHILCLQMVSVWVTITSSHMSPRAKGEIYMSRKNEIYEKIF